MDAGKVVSVTPYACTQMSQASATFVATARALAADRAAAEVVVAWRARGIESILLKGASVAGWLYPGEPRPYGDADLLVDPARVADAAAVLVSLGYAPGPTEVSRHAHPWVRREDAAVIDLHVTLHGADCSPRALWQELARWLEPSEVAAVVVSVPDLPARALLVALHAAQHRDLPKPREDLRRALTRTPDEAWLESDRLADRLWALPTMIEGLGLDRRGALLLERLPHAHALTLAAGARAPLAVGFARLRAAEGWRSRLAALMRAVAPPVHLIRIEHPGRRLGRASVVLAYVVRLVRLPAAALLTSIRLRRARRR